MRMSATSRECYEWQSGAEGSRTLDLLNSISIHPLRDRARRCANGHFTRVFTPSRSPLTTHRGPSNHCRTTAVGVPSRRHDPALLPDRAQHWHRQLTGGRCEHCRARARYALIRKRGDVSSRRPESPAGDSEPKAGQRDHTQEHAVDYSPGLRRERHPRMPHDRRGAPHDAEDDEEDAFRLSPICSVPFHPAHRLLDPLSFRRHSPAAPPSHLTECLAADLLNCSYEVGGGNSRTKEGAAAGGPGVVRADSFIAAALCRTAPPPCTRRTSRASSRRAAQCAFRAARGRPPHAEERSPDRLPTRRLSS